MVQAGLSQQVEEGDYDGLVEVMGNLLAVKERQNTTDTMFEPLQQTIALLKEYEQELPDVVYKQLEVRSDVQSSPIIFKPRLFSLFLPTETEQFFFLFLCFFKSLFHALPPGNPSSVNPALLAFLPSLYLSLHLPVCLQELPDKWDNVKKQAVLVKQQVAPLQAVEVSGLRRKCAAFDVEQHTFREHFRKSKLFR